MLWIHIWCGHDDDAVTYCAVYLLSHPLRRHRILTHRECAIPRQMSIHVQRCINTTGWGWAPAGCGGCSVTESLSVAFTCRGSSAAHAKPPKRQVLRGLSSRRRRTAELELLNAQLSGRSIFALWRLGVRKVFLPPGAKVAPPQLPTGARPDRCYILLQFIGRR
jgi:hypothetical protein